MQCYVGSYTHSVSGEAPTGSRGIYQCRLDESHGTLTEKGAEGSTVNPSFLAVSADGGLLLAAGERVQGGGLSSYRVLADGSLALIDRLPLQGRECCFVEIAPDRSFAIGANYGSGEVFTCGLREDGRFGEIAFSHVNVGSGPVKERQKRAHAHSARLIPGLGVAAVCDLGCDTVSFFAYSPGGAMRPAPLPAIHTPRGCGPRHSEFSEDGQRLYISCELSNEVLYYRLQSGAYVLCQRISTLEGSFSGQNTAADIHFGPGRKTLHVSNRGDDSIASYFVGEDGALQWAGRVSCGGRTPRQFAVTPAFMLCANQGSGNVAVLRLDGRGLPGEPCSSLAVPAATCVLVPPPRKGGGPL